MKNMKFLHDLAAKWLIYSIFGMFFLTLINTCNSCSHNSENTLMRKELIVLKNEIDSLDDVVLEYKNIVDSLPVKFQENDDEQTAKFLYWERQADKPEYNSYTIKDYYTIIKK